MINEATSDGSSGSFETVVFPIVRRVFSKLLANDIVSVQAMNLPIGKLFYFVPKIQGYNNGIGGSGAFDQSSGEHYAPVGSPGNYPGNPDSGYTTGVGSYNSTYAKNLYDLFYEGTEPGLNPAGLFDYSKGRWSAITSTATVVSWQNGTLASYTGTSGNVRKVIISLCGFNDLGYGKLLGPDGSEMDTESFLSNLIVYTGSGLAVTAGSPCTVSTGPLLYRVVTQQYGRGIVNPNYTQTPTTFPGANGGSYDLSLIHI